MAGAEGKDLAAELEKILHIAEENIPNMASTYNSANSTLAGVDISGAFATGAFSAGLDGSWNDVRNDMQIRLGQTQTNLEDTAAALYGVLNHYITSDDTAAEELRSRVDEMNEELAQEHGDQNAGTPGGPDENNVSNDKTLQSPDLDSSTPLEVPESDLPDPEMPEPEDAT